MIKSTITIDVEMDDKRLPEAIVWNATDNITGKPQRSKAMMLSFWDGEEKTALRIDLWAKTMMIDEMADFFYQTMMTMADTYGRATNHADITADMKKFAGEFYHKSREKQLKEHKA